MIQKIENKDLISLFDPDNIRYGQSIQKLKNWGGYAGLESMLRTNFNTGIKNDLGDIVRRREVWGDNKPVKRLSKFRRIKENKWKILAIFTIILVSLCISIIFFPQKLQKIFPIFLIISLNYTINKINEYLQDYLSINNQYKQSQKVIVIRGGTEYVINEEELVVGDIVKFQEGFVVPADCILVKGRDIVLDQSSFKGSVIEFKKNIPINFTQNQNPFLPSLNRILEGRGLMVVVSVLKNTINGNIINKLQINYEQTFIQQTIQKLYKKIYIKITLCGLIIILVYLLYNYSNKNFVKNHISLDFLSLIIVIIFFPLSSSLNLTLTIISYNSMHNLNQQKILVKYRQSLQKIGKINTLLTDITGTMTTNVMNVHKMFIEEKQIYSVSRDCVGEGTIQLLCKTIYNCITPNPNPTQKLPHHKKTPLQQALHDLIIQLGYNKKQKNKGLTTQYYPYGPGHGSRRRRTVAHQDQDGRQWVYVVGDPENVLPHCTKYINGQGNITEISQQFRGRIYQMNKKFGSQLLKTVLLAYKQYQPNTQLQQNLIIITLIGIKNPIQKSTKQTLTKITKAGIDIRIVTEECKDRAIAVAIQTGILPQDWYQYRYQNANFMVMEGKQFREYVGGLKQTGYGDKIGDIKRFQKIVKYMRVLAHASSTDKYLLVLGLRQLQNKVGLISDLTDDTPAIKSSDIGICKKTSISNLLKQSSHIIIHESNIKSFIPLLQNSRNIEHVLQKCLQFQVITILVMMVVLGVGIFVTGTFVFSGIEIVWGKVLMEILIFTVIIGEQPTDTILPNPDKTTHKIHTSTTPKIILLQLLTQTLILITILTKLPIILNIPSSFKKQIITEQISKNSTIFYNSFVMLQIFNVIDVCRFRDNNYSVWKFLRSFLWVFGIIFIHVVVSYYGLLRTVKMSIKEYVLCVLIGSLSMLVNFIINYIVPFVLVSDDKKFKFNECNELKEINEIKESKNITFKKLLSNNMNQSYLH